MATTITLNQTISRKKSRPIAQLIVAMACSSTAIADATQDKLIQLGVNALKSAIASNNKAVAENSSQQSATGSDAAASVIDASNLPDTLGVRLRMSVQETLDILNAKQPKFRIESHEMEIENLGGQTYTNLIIATDNKSAAGNGYSSLNIKFTAPPNKPSSWQISRTSLYYDEFKKRYFNDAPSIESLTGGMTEKWGKPTYAEPVSNTGGRLYWMWNPAGKLMAKGNMDARSFELCKNNASVSSYNELGVPNHIATISTYCAAIVKLEYRSSLRDGVVQSFSLVINDHSGVYAASVATSQAASEWGKQKANQNLGRANQNRPEL